MSCNKAQEFLAKHKTTVASSTSTRQKTFDHKDALALLDGVQILYSGKGKKIERVDLTKARPDPATLARLMLGPTGNLRAPTLRIGRTLMVGYHEETYRELLLK